jgi:hypothetical protein
MKIQEIHYNYEREVDSISQDNIKLYKECVNCKTEFNNLREKYEILLDNNEKLKNSHDKNMPISTFVATINCRKLFKDINYQYEFDNQKLNTGIEYIKNIQPKNEYKQLILIAECNHLRSQIRKLKQNLKYIICILINKI